MGDLDPVTAVLRSTFTCYLVLCSTFTRTKLAVKSLAVKSVPRCCDPKIRNQNTSKRKGPHYLPQAPSQHSYASTCTHQARHSQQRFQTTQANKSPHSSHATRFHQATDQRQPGIASRRSRRDVCKQAAMGLPTRRPRGGTYLF